MDKRVREYKSPQERAL
jgi:hypothetical protein